VPSDTAVDPRRKVGPRTPVLFISHGSPLVLMVEDFKRSLRRFCVHLRDPRAIVVISAHWQTMRPVHVTSSARPGMIHDFAGFPSWTDTTSYNCPGDPALARALVARLAAAGIPAVEDASYGIDSGAWIPLVMMFPTAKIPVVQISLPKPCTPDEARAIGAALAPLRYDGVLFICSGGIVHNLTRVRFDLHDPPVEPWAQAFDGWVADCLDAHDYDTLMAYRAHGPQSHLAAPSSEHLDPLFVALGLLMQGDRTRTIHEGFHAGALSLRSLAFGGRRLEDWRLPDVLVRK
jgi:4,5-DOPA dioxygenase extradiol